MDQHWIKTESSFIEVKSSLIGESLDHQSIWSQKTKQKVRAFKIRVKGKAYRKVKIARKMKGVSRCKMTTKAAYIS